MDFILKVALEIICAILIFVVIFLAGKYIYHRLDKSSSRLLNPAEFFPDEEIHTLTQVFYLIMMLIFFVLILYLLIYVTSDSYIFAFIDVIVSLYLIINLDATTWKKRILTICLIPIGSITFLIFGITTTEYLDFIHIIAYLYFMHIYYGKFKQYTETNGLGITIVLLFLIIFISFMITTVAENVDPLNSIVMVSNAFTSNGYAVLGSSPVGKLDSLFLVWGGYILSSVGTATLTAAILARHYNKKFDELKELIRDEIKK